MNTALYTGSFDPITKGHLDIIRTGANMFDKLIVGVGTNPKKTYTFTQTERTDMISHNLKDLPNVVVVDVPHGKLTADVAFEYNAVILKGVRIGSNDFDYEWLMADINQAHVAGLRTIIVPASLEFNSVSSSAAKEVCKLHGKTEDFVPLNVKAALERKLVNQKRVTITGIIGCGKSTICKQLIWNADYRKDYNMVHNIDLDIIAKDILFERTEPAYKNIRLQIQDALELKEWSKKALGDCIFKSEEARKRLSELMCQSLETRIRAELCGKEGLILINGALVVEAKWLHLSNNNVVLLDVDQPTQAARLKARGYTTHQLRRRVNAQLDTNQKEELILKQIEQDGYGTYRTIDTSGCKVETTAEIIEAFINHQIK